MAGLIVLIVVAIVVLFTIARGVRIVPQARAGIVERLGRYQRTLDPGLALVIPYVDRVRPLLDMREQVVSFPPQPVITEDNLTIQIDTVIYFQVTDPKSASYEIADFISAIEQLVLTTLRNVCGGMTLEQTLTSRDTVSAALRIVLDEATGRWGIRVNRVELEVGRPAALDPGGDGEADARRARPPRGHPHRRGRQAVPDPDRRGREAELDPARRGPARVADPAGRGPVQGHRDRVRGHPPGRRRPQAAGLPVPADPAADRPGRREQGLDRAQRVHPGAGQHRVDVAKRTRATSGPSRRRLRGHPASLRRPCSTPSQSG